jgi:outer membrane assembly lipoprotein YfiO
MIREVNCRLLGGIRRIVIPAVSVVVLISCGGSDPRPSPSAEEMYAKAQDLFERHKWEKAGYEFENFIFSFPGAARVDSAQFHLGMCYFNMKDYIRAEDEFKRLHRRYPTSLLVDEADLLGARSLLSIAPKNPGLDQERTEEAITQLRLYKDNHPLSPNVAIADSLLQVAYGRLSERDFKAGKLYHRMGHYRASRIYFQEIFDNYPESPRVPEAVYLAAEGYRKQDSLDRAIEYYEKLIYLYPDHKRTSKAKKRVADLARRREELQAAEAQQPPP